MNEKLWMLTISIVLLALALVLCVPAQNQNTNCWDQYTTENAAILGCEK